MEKILRWLFINLIPRKLRNIIYLNKIKKELDKDKSIEKDIKENYGRSNRRIQESK